MKIKIFFHKSQVIPVFIALLTLLVIAMFVTVNIGKIAYYKIYVQNAADSGALSGGAAMARVFNITADWNEKYFMDKYDKFYQDMEIQFKAVNNYLKLAETYTQKAIDYLNNNVGAISGATACKAANALAIPQGMSKHPNLETNIDIAKTYIGDLPEPPPFNPPPPPPVITSDYYKEVLKLMPIVRAYQEIVWQRYIATTKMVDRGRLEALRESYSFAFENSGILISNKGAKNFDQEKSCFRQYSCPNYQNYQKFSHDRCITTPYVDYPGCFNIRTEVCDENNKKDVDTCLKNLYSCLKNNAESRRAIQEEIKIDKTGVATTEAANSAIIENGIRQEYNWSDRYKDPAQAPLIVPNRKVTISGPIAAENAPPSQIINPIPKYELWFLNLMKHNPDPKVIRFQPRDPAYNNDVNRPRPGEPRWQVNDLDQIDTQLRNFPVVIQDKYNKAKSSIQNARFWAAMACICCWLGCKKCAEWAARAEGHRKTAKAWLTSAMRERTLLEKFLLNLKGELPHCIQHAKDWIEAYKEGLQISFPQGTNFKRRLSLSPTVNKDLTQPPASVMQTQEIIYAINYLLQADGPPKPVEHDNLVTVEVSQKHSEQDFGLWKISYPTIIKDRSKVNFLGEDISVNPPIKGLICSDSHDLVTKYEKCKPKKEFKPSIKQTK